MSHLSLSLLGTLQFALDGQPISGFATDKVRALLVYLAVESYKPHRREELAELLWPEMNGLSSLRTALANLRHAIGDDEADPPFLLRNREELQFNHESHFTLDVSAISELFDQCDKHDHENIESCAVCIARLQQAVEMYRGAFAENLVLQDCDDFERWLDQRRQSLSIMALESLYNLAEYHQKRGAYDLARRFAWRQIELEPSREEAYRQLMYLLALTGQRTAALAQYERCCRVLEDELGVPVSPETTALYKAIEASEISPVPLQPSATTVVQKTTLATFPTPFIGREQEIEKLLERLGDPACRLVTVVGLGGMGKTRLALEAARQTNNIFQGVYFVPLASLTSPDLIASAIADALDYSTMNQHDFAAQLINYLSDKRLLLVLDNMEHLTAGSQLLAEIVARAPGVKLLVTSRERLNLQGEWVFNLKGLPIREDASTSGDEHGAIWLFVQRAQMARADFGYSDAILPSITRICRLMDGMPLGIEMAAAWVQMLSCQEIADSIASNLAFLTASFRGLPERQQSLRAIFEHSWDLLSVDQQRIFGALSVFRGGFQADGALEVAGATLPTLLTFVNKSMLHRDLKGRYEIHELLRQYALEKLHETGESEEVFNRHLHYYVSLAQSAEPQIQGGHQVPWLERLDAENDNLRAALDWSLKGQLPEIGLRLAASLWFFWHVRHYVRESLDWLEKLLAAAQEAPMSIRAKALFAAGWQAQSQRDFALAASYSEASVQLARQEGDKRNIAYPLSTLAWLAYFRGDYGAATQLGEECLTLFREVKDSWGIVHTLNILGYIAESQADYARAEAFQREGIVEARAAGDNDSLGWSIYLLGRIMAERGQNDQAIQLCNQSLEIYRETRNNWGVALVLYTLGESALALGDLSKATELAQESCTLLREMSDLWAVGGPLSTLGLIAYRQGKYLDAIKFSEESLGYFGRSGDKRGMAYALNTLGYVFKSQGQLRKASDSFKKSLTLRREAGILRGVEVCFEQLAEIAAMQKQADRAAWLFGAAESVCETLEIAVPDHDKPGYDNSIEIVRQQLGDSAFNAAWNAGRQQPRNQAIDNALNDTRDVQK